MSFDIHFPIPCANLNIQFAVISFHSEPLLPLSNVLILHNVIVAGLSAAPAWRCVWEVESCWTTVID